MKKVKLICCILALSMIFGLPCMAAGERHEPTTVPEKIEIEGGILELVGVAEDSAKTVQPRYVYKVVTDGGNLNVRKEPNSNSDIIGQFANGSYVDISFWQPGGIAPWELATGTNVWDGKEITGYVHGDYIGNI